MALRDVIGHRRLITLLAGAIERDSLPPTLLFAGPVGVGKWRVATAVAQALNCLEPVRTLDGIPFDACGRCRSCDRIARGVHVDVLGLQPDERASIKIDSVRDVLDGTGYRPFEGKRRVVIIRDADALETAAQNAMLKKLEEPPPGTMFILTSAVPGALLPTVRSRCMRLRFARLKASEVTAFLVREHNQSEAEAHSTAELAGGSIGQALALSDADLTALRDAALRALQQSAGRPDIQTRLQAAVNFIGGPSKSKERSREELAVVLRLTASMLRDIEVLHAGAAASVLANRAIETDLARLAPSFGGDRGRAAFGAVDRALAALERNAGLKVVSEWLAVQL
jgi:DNA polymerase-3 subunit delta'